MAKDTQIDFSAALFGNGDIPQTLQPDPQIEIFKGITKEIYSTKNIAVKTELNDKQIMVFSTAMTFAKRYKVPLLKELVNNYCTYAISKGRKSRKEFENIGKAVFQMSNIDENERHSSIPDRILGRGR